MVLERTSAIEPRTNSFIAVVAKGLGFVFIFVAKSVFVITSVFFSFFFFLGGWGFWRERGGIEGENRETEEIDTQTKRQRSLDKKRIGRGGDKVGGGWGERSDAEVGEGVGGLQ